MAHQYSSAPAYGAQYSASPYYSPFNPSAVQQASNGTQTFQASVAHAPNHQNPANMSNAARHSANTTIHPQTAPLPFVPPFNPEMLKHFPPPPLPPPVGAHFGSAHGVATGFPPYIPVGLTPPLPAPHQNYPQFQQSVTPLPVGVSSTQTQSGQERGVYSQAVANQDSAYLMENSRRQVTPIQTNPESPVTELALPRATHIADGSLPGSSFLPTSLQLTGPSTPQLHLARDYVDQANPMNSSLVPALDDGEPQSQDMLQSSNLANPSQLELKERAKAALLSLLPYNIQYDNFLAEGIRAQTLQELYNELGLNWRSSELRTNTGISDPNGGVLQLQTSTRHEGEDRAPLQAPTIASGTSLAAKASPAVAPLTQSISTASQGIERKDRIAQLLAAKAGKASVPAEQSKSQSPASSVEQSPFQIPEPGVSAPVFGTHQAKLPRNKAQAEIVKQKMERLKKETMARAKAEQALHDTASTISNDKQVASSDLPQTQEHVPLSTPMRETLAQHGFSSLIPGLFMTSADPEENNSEVQQPENIHIDTAHKVPSPSQDSLDTDNTNAPQSIVQSSLSPRKRSVAEDSLDEEQEQEQQQHQAKRQAVETESLGSTSTDVENANHDENDNVSEGEILEQDTGLETRGASSEALPDSHDQTEHTNQEYLTKQTEIDLMRRRIAEMEQRQNLKRGQSSVMSPTGSTTSTPTINIATQSALSSPLSRLPDQLFGISKGDDRTNQSPRPLLKATPEQIAERAAQLKADFLRQRALRQRQLQDGIPVLNDEVAKTQTTLKDVKSKLAKVQTEIQHHEANIVRAREQEKQLQHEISRLETQVAEGVSGQKHFSNELNDLKDRNNQTSNIQSIPSNAPVSTQYPMGESQLRMRNSSPPPDVQHLVNEEKMDSSRVVMEPNVEHEDEVDDPLRTIPSGKLSPSNEEQSEVGATFDRETLHELGIQQENSQEMDSTSTIHISMEEAQDYSEKADEAMEESDNGTDDSHMSIDEETDDSVSMSDSGSDEYEPAEPELSQAEDEKMDSDEYEPAVGDEGNYDEMAEDDADDYEPAEDISSVNASEDDSIPTNSQSPSTTQATTIVPNSTSPSQTAPLGVSATSELPSKTKADDQENGLQLSEADTLTKAHNMQVEEGIDGSHVLGAAESSSVRYVPYQSPLSSFKSYRFHPLFSEQVKDGYRSLTYSHKIDSKLPICQSELYGNTCTDPDCQDQHFGSMALTDDKILVQMSSANDIKDKVLRDQYLLGLKQVIARLRQEGVKEFSAVADALSQYRREWTAI